MDMETTKTRRVGTREAGGRWTAWFICMALVTVASGCGACQQVIRPTDPGTGPVSACPGGPTCGIDKALLAGITVTDECPTGNCDPGGNGNAKGLYTAEGGNYCFMAGDQRLFCPEAFIHRPKGLMLAIRYLNGAFSVIEYPVSARLAADSSPVYLLAVEGDRTQLTIKYRLNDVAYTLTGDDVSKVILSLSSMPMGHGDATQLISYDMRFFTDQKEKTAKDGVHRYTLKYRELRPGSTWQRHCAGDDETVVSFLPRLRVSGRTGYVKDDATVTTMGCEQGSIVTCLAWGYTPWAPATGVLDETRNYVFQSCLQAKRAAYFVGKGDWRSYTKRGTKIFRRDQYGFARPQDSIDRVEALWSPLGAVCLNTKNRRRPTAEPWLGQNPNNLKTYGVGPCTPEDFTLQGKIFTGPVEDPSTLP
ncbi:MAG TPA: ADYC domain-containing protein [Archangium sp.]|uniref:ADYC domain-containing protein n=1 Tax=Archangium sp. TaxID=1872627 RepID=UPI002E2F9578|nr:ADYC domain-containing protein [Archangium sp.]HEX5749579.1 ADYC domain-containing protein [Archangium sp.]